VYAVFVVLGFHPPLHSQTPTLHPIPHPPPKTQQVLANLAELVTRELESEVLLAQQQLQTQRAAAGVAQQLLWPAAAAAAAAAGPGVGADVRSDVSGQSLVSSSPGQAAACGSPTASSNQKPLLEQYQWILRSEDAITRWVHFLFF